MTTQIPRPRKVSIDMDIHKSLPPLPPEPRTPTTITVTRHFPKTVARSASYSVLRPPISAPISRNREVSCDFPNLAKLKSELFGDGQGGGNEGEGGGEKRICNITALIKSPGEPVPDDPELYECSAWWAGRYMAISDRLKCEMPRASEEEREEKARSQMFALCGDNTQKQRSLQIWWINFTMKQDLREETRKQKAVV
ncbi:hypothetical protein TWF481_007833 [Arthrobotrys musiformis]|uniref:Uncharacterized protein n=1 Tax=Arthrobotrys musiformis TaxID=47236 RepID=A0AAV9W6B5_9PEZI